MIVTIILLLQRFRAVFAFIFYQSQIGQSVLKRFFFVKIKKSKNKATEGTSLSVHTTVSNKHKMY